MTQAGDRCFNSKLRCQTLRRSLSGHGPTSALPEQDENDPSTAAQAAAVIESISIKGCEEVSE
jgi:hypothetical protein